MSAGELSLISASVLTAAACCCFGLGAAIHGRVARDAEATVLLLLLAALGCHYLLWGARDLFDALPRVDAPHARYLLNGAGEICGIIFFALGGHFLALSFRRLIALDESVAANIPGPHLLYPPLIPNPQLGFWMVTVTSYGAALFLLLPYLYYFLRPLGAGWPAGAPPDPAVTLGSYYYFSKGLAVGIYPGIQITVLTLLYQHLPEEKKRRMRFARWVFVDAPADGTVRLGLAGARPDSTAIQALVTVDEWKAFLTLTVGSVACFAAYIWAKDSEIFGTATRSIFELALALAPLLVLLPLVYYKSRLIFFDVLIKRGVVWGAMLVSGVIYFAGLLSQLLRAVEREGPGIEAVALCAGGLLFAAAWVACHDRFERRLDRHLFRRPDYSRLVLEISRETRRHTEPTTLVEDVTLRLREALEAAYVRFVDWSSPGALAMAPGPVGGLQPSDSSEVAAVISVSTDERQWGRLIFGPRPRGQTYGSEDLSFLMTVGNQLADRLDDFARRDERQAREQKLRELSLQSELKALRAQISPHFLFNALGTLAHLARNDPRAAERTVHDLAETFRFALETSREETVTLGAEIDFLTAYLAIERARFGDRLRYEFRIPEKLRGLPLPPMLIQPLVENAVRHGLTLKPTGGVVTISAGLRGDWLTVRVADDGVGFKPGCVEGTRNRGFGLTNVRERVERLSGPGRWRLLSAPGRGTTAEFDIHVGKVVACVQPLNA